MVFTNNEGKDITLRGILLCGTADAPAKCLLQNFVQFNGFNGCPYCMERGKSVKTSAKGHTHAYPFNRDNPLKGYETERTHENTLQHAYDAHKSKLEGKYSPVFGVKGYSWFMFIPGFDIIKGISHTPNAICLPHENATALYYTNSKFNYVKTKQHRYVIKNDNHDCSLFSHCSLNHFLLL